VPTMDEASEITRGRDCKTRLSYWFPRIKAHGLPVPKTKIIRTTLDLVPLADGTAVEGFDDLVEQIAAAGNEMGWPCFLRTDFTSSKSMANLQPRQ
jgi:hypothetical protein